MNPPSRRAWAALALTIMIWASFLVVTRAAMTSRLGIVEVGLMRYGIGGLLFLPVLIGQWRRIREARIRDLILIPVFGGLLFIVLLSAGLRIAPVADSGVFTPSMLPLYTAILAFVLLGERFSGLRLLGFGLIVAGALCVGGWAALHSGIPGVWKGHLLFTAASMSWAAYTILYRLSGLGAGAASAVLCVGSGLVFLVAALITGTAFGSIPFQTLVIQVVFQGVLSGFIATYTFFYAVTQIGPSRSAAFAALVPVLAALGGWIFLGEPIGPVKAAGILVVALGVALASGALSRRKRGAQDVPDNG